MDSIFAGGSAVTRDDWTGTAVVTTSVTYTGTAQNLPVIATDSFIVVTRIGQSAAWADSSFGTFPATPPSPIFVSGAPLRDSYPGIHPTPDGYTANEGALGETFFQYPGDITIVRLGGVGPNRSVRFVFSVPWATLAEAGGLPAGVYVEHNLLPVQPNSPRCIMVP